MRSRLLVLSWITTFLTACGGGDASHPPATSIDPIDRYIGTWNKICDTWPLSAITDLHGNGVSVIESITLTKTSSTQATFTWTAKIYANSDTTCAASPIATLVTIGKNDQSQSISNSTATMTTGFGVNNFSYLSPQALQSETVDKVQAATAKLSADNSFTTVGSTIVNTGASEFQGQQTDMLVKFKTAAQMLTNAIDNNVIPAQMTDDKYLVWSKQ
jgi:hypothetical protein